MLAHEQVSWQVDCPKQSFVLMLVSMLNVIMCTRMVGSQYEAKCSSVPTKSAMLMTHML